MAVDPSGFPLQPPAQAPLDPAPAPAPPPADPGPAPAPAPTPQPQPVVPPPADPSTTSSIPIDRSEVAAAAGLVQAGAALAVSFGAHLSTVQQEALLTFEGAIAALVVAYLLHRRDRAA